MGVPAGGMAPEAGDAEASARAGGPVRLRFGTRLVGGGDGSQHQATLLPVLPLVGAPVQTQRPGIRLRGMAGGRKANLLRAQAFPPTCRLSPAKTHRPAPAAAFREHELGTQANAFG